jgi:osmotically-inducible protein OsmY
VKKLNRKNRSGLLVFVVLAGLFVAPDLTIAQTQNAQAPTDDTIGFWVVEALREDPRVRFSGIRVKTENGIVTLTGTVVSLAERNYAPLISMKIQGVRGVVNQLEVQTANRPDGDVVRDVQRRILLSSSIRIQGLDVKANAGTVRLAGTVGSPCWPVKCMA